MPVTDLGDPKGYATEEDIENFIQVDVDVAALGQQTFENWQIWVEKFIDDYTGQDFKVAADETLYLDGSGRRDIYLPKFPVISITGIEILDANNTWKAQVRSEYLPPDSGYENLKNKGQIIFDSNQVTTSDPGIFRKGTQNIKIIGKFGFTTPPADINFAAAFLVGEIINHVYQHPSEVESERLGQYQVKYLVQEKTVSNKDVREILDKYKGAHVSA